ncbi:ATP-binding cassette domain-containing protein [Streptomyces sp. NPDC012794]|uniref:ATP-binding cassette domain-containing protein n=1 Tax=Streptomyces sp. NPDC012794 TaxID=3364850 RepID=UPI003696B07A
MRTSSSDVISPPLGLRDFPRYPGPAQQRCLGVLWWSAGLRRGGRRRAWRRSVLCAAGLRKSISGRRVLDGVDLVPPRGRIAGITGENGSGTTTVLRVQLGDLKPDVGRVVFRPARPLSAGSGPQPAAQGSITRRMRCSGGRPGSCGRTSRLSQGVEHASLGGGVVLAHPRYAGLSSASCPALRRTGRWPDLSSASPTVPSGPGDTTSQVIRSAGGHSHAGPGGQRRSCRAAENLTGEARSSRWPSPSPTDPWSASSAQPIPRSRQPCTGGAARSAGLRGWLLR